MNAPQVHLMLNHVPVVGALFAVVTLAIGRWWRSGPLVRFGTWILFAIAVVAIPVFLSGEPAEHAIEHAIGVSENVVASHEDVARPSLIGLEVLGLLALFGLVRFRRTDVPREFATVLLVLALTLSAMLVWTAHLGGQIRHPELRATPSATASSVDR